MVFKDVGDKIFEAFKTEYRGSEIFKQGFGWRAFLTNKDIGVNCIDKKHINNVFNIQDALLTTSTYEIVDQKKWLLAKIKYGF